MTFSDPMHLPLGDPSFFRDLAKRSGVTITRELISSAPISIRKELIQIFDALEKKDAKQLQATCHALKGACYSMQAHRLAHFVREMELSANDLESAANIFLVVKAVGDETIAWWEGILLNSDYLNVPVQDL